MTPLFFPDNTVLINFAHLNRIDLLEQLAGENGRWCATVARECAQSAQIQGLEALDDVPAIFGEPLRPETPVEHLDTVTLRDDLAKPGDAPHHHLGEAETLAIITRRQLHGIFVTDDRSARMLAAKHNVGTATTWDLLRLATRVGLVDENTVWGYIQTLGSLERGQPPGVHDRPSFELWIK